MVHRTARLVVALLVCVLLIPTARPAEPARKVDFSRDIRPILSDNCFACHGPDPKARKADLRLDTKADLLGSGTVVPGKAGESELVKRVTSADPAEVMPPPKSIKKLRPEQVAILKRWVDEGAKWGQHWAFVKPVHLEPPRSRDPKPPAQPGMREHG